MSESRAVAAWSGIGFVALQVLATILSGFGGVPPALDDSAARAAYAARNASLLITVAIVAAFAVMPFYSYLLGLRAVILRGGEAVDRPATAAWGTGLVLGGLMIVAAALFAAGAIDASGRPDATIIRAFAEASTALMSLAAIVAALFLLTAARGTLNGAVLPRWTGYVGNAGALLNVASVFGLYASGPAAGLVILVGFLPLLVYVAATSIAMLRLPAAAYAPLRASL
jgi:hypothetical protein